MPHSAGRHTVLQSFNRKASRRFCKGLNRQNNRQLKYFNFKQNPARTRNTGGVHWEYIGRFYRPLCDLTNKTGHHTKAFGRLPLYHSVGGAASYGLSRFIETGAGVIPCFAKTALAERLNSTLPPAISRCNRP